MSSSYDLYDDVTGCYSYDFPDTNDQYVFVGAHHSTIVNLKEPHEEKKPPQWRDRTLSGNMAGFCQNGLHAKVSPPHFSLPLILPQACIHHCNWNDCLTSNDRERTTHQTPSPTDQEHTQQPVRQ